MQDLKTAPAAGAGQGQASAVEEGPPCLDSAGLCLPPPQKQPSKRSADECALLTDSTHTPTPNSRVQAKKNEVSDSYAKALVELADEKGSLEQVHADIDAVASLLKENQKLTEL